MKNWLKDKTADVELDELAKIILGLVLLLVLIYIVTIVINGELSNQVQRVKDIFNFF